MKRNCEAGHTGVFDDSGSFMSKEATGEINILREECGRQAEVSKGGLNVSGF